MEKFALDLLLESINDGDIATAQLAIREMEKRGLELVVRPKESPDSSRNAR